MGPVSQHPVSLQRILLLYRRLHGAGLGHFDDQPAVSVAGLEHVGRSRCAARLEVEQDAAVAVLDPGVLGEGVCVVGVDLLRIRELLHDVFANLVVGERPRGWVIVATWRM